MSQGSQAQPADPGCTVILAELRQILADVTRRPELLDARADAPLFGTGIGLDSLAGTLLLREITHRYGVDVAAEDINLDALVSLATLADFILARSPGRAMGERASARRTGHEHPQDRLRGHDRDQHPAGH